MMISRGSRALEFGLLTALSLPMDAKISVIIPLYQEAPGIPRGVVESDCAQTDLSGVSGVEVVVADDGSVNRLSCGMGDASWRKTDPRPNIWKTRYGEGASGMRIGIDPMCGSYETR